KKKKRKKEKKKKKAEKKAEKKEAKAKAKLEKKNKKESSKNSDNKNDAPKKKNFLSIKNLIIFSVVFLILIGSGFIAYKKFFSKSDAPIEYKSVVLKNVNLPDEMLEFSFNYINDLYYAFATYNLRIFLMDKEINRINKVGETYPDQNKIADKEKKDWIKAKEKVEKRFIKIEKAIKELYVLYNVNKEEGLKKVEEKSTELILQANEALKTLDPYIVKTGINKDVEPQGFINKTMYKIKNIF
ncbi:MAG: hypothetical protein KAR45_23590, partial [Desulfobacteraceae bacterium]|nr:hypothetical protein [Desulfobacteraceae bacterium]